MNEPICKKTFSIFFCCDGKRHRLHTIFNAILKIKNASLTYKDLCNNQNLVFANIIIATLAQNLIALRVDDDVRWLFVFGIVNFIASHDICNQTQLSSLSKISISFPNFVVFFSLLNGIKTRCVC